MRGTTAGAWLLITLAQVWGCSSEPSLAAVGASLTNTRCGRGVALINSDYQSSSVALIDAAGQVASHHFISSASAPVALTAPLSGDMALPNSIIAGDEAILIDRFPASVLTWVRLSDASVRAQLDVSTGFASNPQDVLPLADGRLYVSRFESHTNPGQQPYDAGGDLLIVAGDPPHIAGRIDLQPALSDAPGYLPRANAMAHVNGSVFVLLAAHNTGFGDAAPSRLVRVDPASDNIQQVTVLTGLYGCTALAVSSPSQPPLRMAVSCTGRFDDAGEPVVTESGVAILDAEGTLQQVWMAPQSGVRGYGQTVAWLDERHLLAVKLGTSVGPEVVTDALVMVRIADGAVQTLLRSPTRPFELGQLTCLHPIAGTGALPDAAACGQCWLADAERGALQRIAGPGEDVQLLTPIHIDDGVGLPPRGLGRL